jgi:glycosyltransferase involved in cell wall biosynthesis
LLAEKQLSVLTVDDGSSMDHLANFSHPNLYTSRHSINLGQGAALQTGFAIARLLNPEYVITMDGDGQHDSVSIPSLVQAITSTKKDILLGKRNLSNANILTIRKVILRLGVLFNWIYTGIKLSDAHNGYRILSRTAYTKIELKEPAMAHATEILEQIKKHNLSYGEQEVLVLYTDYSRGKGQKNINALSIVKNLIFRRLL